MRKRRSNHSFPKGCDRERKEQADWVWAASHFLYSSWVLLTSFLFCARWSQYYLMGCSSHEHTVSLLIPDSRVRSANSNHLLSRKSFLVANCVQILNGSIPVILATMTAVADVPVGQSLIVLLILDKDETKLDTQNSTLKAVLAVRAVGF